MPDMENVVANAMSWPLVEAPQPPDVVAVGPPASTDRLSGRSRQPPGHMGGAGEVADFKQPPTGPGGVTGTAGPPGMV